MGRERANYWTRGYSQAELDQAQERYGLVFPPDLVALYLDRRPVDAYDWRTDQVHIAWALARPLEGLLFDVEENVLWWPEWGERPATAAERAEVMSAIVEAAPPLIPLYAHRYIPQEPQEAGNPIFSIMQSDIIYYGTDLLDYFEREFGSARDKQMGPPVRRVPFWSDFIVRNF